MRLVLVDDQRLVREGLRALIERLGDADVVGEGESGHDAIALAGQLKPDVLLMDVAMPVLNGIDATRAVVAEAPRVRVLGLSMHADRAHVLAMFDAGASGYLLKSASADELASALQSVAAGRAYISPAIADVVLSGLGQPKPAAPPAQSAPLSARERHVLQLLAEGKTSKEIATVLTIAVCTVESHRRQIMQKLDLHSTAALTKYAIREGLTSLER